MSRRAAPRCRRRLSDAPAYDPDAPWGRNPTRRPTSDPLADGNRGLLEYGDIKLYILRHRPTEDRGSYAILWARYGAEILREWIEDFPGTRPMACYLLNEIEPPMAQHLAPGDRRPLEFGGEIVIPDSCWHTTDIEFAHLVRLGVVVGAERRIATEFYGRPTAKLAPDFTLI